MRSRDETLAVRILYHHRTAAEDGQAVHIRELIAAFRALGHEVHEASLVPRTQAEANPSKPRFSWITRAPRFARELAEYGYGVVAKRTLLQAAREFRPDFLYE